MGLITEEVEMRWNNNNKKWYESKGYIFTYYGDGFKAKVKDLTNNSHIKVDVKCNNCGEELKDVIWQNYINHVHKDDEYYCHKCSCKLFGTNKMKKTKLNNSKSFQDWCIEHNRQDVLNRWDYNLNDCLPNEITYATREKYYFKCPIHDSELKRIGDFTSGKDGTMDCKKCNSFAYYLISIFGEDALDKYWNKEKNDELGIDPWKISKGAQKPKIWIKCQEKDYHGSYDIIPKSFVRGSRCPECKRSKGEEKINYYLIDNTFIKISDSDYQLLDNIFKSQYNYYIYQKEFERLIGLGNGNLSYDFYIPKFNLLIEFQGKQHEKYIPGFHKSYEDFEKQQEHDKRKREYAENNNINLLEIWYWDFDNIEEILDNYFKNLKIINL